MAATNPEAAPHSKVEQPEGLSAQSWTPIAHLLRPQGRRGELLAEPLSDLPGLFTAGRSFGLSTPAAANASPSPAGESVTLEKSWKPTGRQASRLVLKLSGIDSISAAELLMGRTLLLLTTELPSLDPDTFLVQDLIGCTVVDAGAPVGTVLGLEFVTSPDGRTRSEDAAPLLIVQPLAAPEAEPALIPFVRAWLQTVDLPARCILMTLPEGLLALPSADLEPNAGAPRS